MKREKGSYFVSVKWITKTLLLEGLFYLLADIFSIKSPAS